MRDLSSPVDLVDLSRCAFDDLDLARAGSGDPLRHVFGDLLLDALRDRPRGDRGESLLSDFADLSFCPLGDLLLEAMGDLLLEGFGAFGDLSLDLGDLLKEVLVIFGDLSLGSFGALVGLNLGDLSLGIFCVFCVLSFNVLGVLVDLSLEVLGVFRDLSLGVLGDLSVGGLGVFTVIFVFFDFSSERVFLLFGRATSIVTLLEL